MIEKCLRPAMHVEGKSQSHLCHPYVYLKTLYDEVNVNVLCKTRIKRYTINLGLARTRFGGSTVSEEDERRRVNNEASKSPEGRRILRHRVRRHTIHQSLLY